MDVWSDTAVWGERNITVSIWRKHVSIDLPPPNNPIPENPPQGQRTSSKHHYIGTHHKDVCSSFAHSGRKPDTNSAMIECDGTFTSWDALQPLKQWIRATQVTQGPSTRYWCVKKQYTDMCIIHPRFYVTVTVAKCVYMCIYRKLHKLKKKKNPCWHYMEDGGGTTQRTKRGKPKENPPLHIYDMITLLYLYKIIYACIQKVF